jgi:hypothetical protein
MGTRDFSIVYRTSRKRTWGSRMLSGGFFLLIARAIYLSHPAAFLVLPLYVLYMNQFQPEERALALLFGDGSRPTPRECADGSNAMIMVAESQIRHAADPLDVRSPR